MKRFFVLLLVVCMLMSSAALADESKVLQDEQPPMVVTTVNEAGETVVATICDADGNVICEVLDDGSLVMTDVHFREKTDNVVIMNRLSSAYEGVMKDVNYSDVDCELHEDDVKEDINNSLTGLEQMDAYYLVMYELFDVMASDEVAANLVDGNYLELTLEVMEEQSLPLVTIFTHDGVEWKIIPTESVGENRFTVSLTELGTIALLNDGKESMGIGQDVEPVVIEIPGTPGTPGDDDGNFTPSVSGKPAPSIVPVEGSDGEQYVGYIRNRNGDVEIGIPDENYIIVTSVAERDYIADILTHEHLEWGYESILNVENVGDLVSDSDDGTIEAELDATLAELGLDMTHEQLVVKDLFEVTAYGDYLEYLYNEDYYVEVTFDANIDPDKALVVIHSEDSVHWHVHPIEEFAVSEAGTVTLKMYDLGAVAFLVEAEEEVNAETAVQSPN